MDFEQKKIPYTMARFKDVADAKLAVLAGNADLTSGALTGINTTQIKAGDMTLLWIYSSKRYPEFPDAPTHVELGMPKEWSDYALTRLIQVPPGTPGHIQSALREGLIKAFKDKRTIEWSEKADTPVDLLPEPELKQRINFLIKSFNENKKIVDTYYYRPRYELRNRRNLFIKAEFFTPWCEGKEIRLIKSRWLFEPPEASSLVAPASGLTDFLLAAATA